MKTKQGRKSLQFIEASGEPAPPNCAELEKMLISAILYNDRWIPRIKSFLKPEYFYIKQNGEYYTWILETYTKRRAVDGEMFFNRFYDDSHPEMYEEIERLGRDLGAGSYDAVQYAKLIQEDAARRSIIQIAQKAVIEAYKPDSDVIGLTGDIQSKARRISSSMTNSSSSMDWKTSIDYHIDEMLARRIAPADKPTRFTFNGRIGLPGLNKYVPPVESGDLVGLLAEPGVGKTVALEQISDGWNMEGERGVFFHLELKPITMMDRRAQRYSGIPIAALREANKAMSDEQWDLYIKTMDDLYKWPGQLHYEHCPGWTASQIIAKATEIKEADGLDYIIIDYYNKIKPVITDGRNFSQAKGEVIEDIKTFIENADLRCVMAAQFDKESKKGRVTQFKTTNDARDTGELQDKVNVSLILDRKRDSSDNNKRQQDGRIYVDKCNAGEEGSIPIRFIGETLRFVELTTEAWNE
jgi:replicative DNA helicase